MTKYARTLKVLYSKIGEETDKLNTCEINLRLKENIHSTCKHQSDEIKREIEEIEEEQSKLVAKLNFLENEIKNMAELKQKENISSSGNIDLTRNEQLRAERDRLNSSIMEIRVQIATKESLLANIDENINRLVSEQAMLNENIDENQSMLIKNQKSLETAKALGESKDEKAIGAKQQEIDDCQRKEKELDEAKDKIHEILQKLEEERERLNVELAKAQERQFQEEAKLGQIDNNLEMMKERIYEEYELTYSTATSLRMEDYDHKEGVQRISEIKKEISKLGYVNVNAIEDSRLMDERYQLYVKEMDDLTKAEQDIVVIIKDLSQQMTEKFEVAFNKINSNFTMIFRQLFGGGNARLVLSEGEDILNAGVEIIAEPPGKKLQNLTLLSGGEKALTAIAILFAILKLRPMPFCLLDEIEAALDDANVERFAKYLHNFAESTQFIVITHRKPTMELADSLYGVTMEEEGVSKIVSVKLSDAIKVSDTKKQAKASN